MLELLHVQTREIPRRLELSTDRCRGIVRAVLMSGKVQEIYRTAVVQNSLKPVWKEARNVGLDLHF